MKRKKIIIDVQVKERMPYSRLQRSFKLKKKYNRTRLKLESFD